MKCLAIIGLALSGCTTNYYPNGPSSSPVPMPSGHYTVDSLFDAIKEGEVGQVWDLQDPNKPGVEIHCTRTK